MKSPFLSRMLLVFSVVIFPGGLAGCNAGKAVSPLEPARLPSESPYINLDTLEEGSILHVPTGIKVGKEDLFRHIGKSRVIYIGESHTNVFDHDVQLEIIKGLWKLYPGEISIGMEMFQKPAQEALKGWVEGTMDEKSFLKVWYKNWYQDFRYYSKILNFSRENKIPLVALNASARLVDKARELGIDNLPEDLREDLPEIDPGDPYHRQKVSSVFGGHSQSEEGFESFYKTMLIWDETMAESVSEYLSSPEGSGKKMVVLAGGFHVNYGFGIPRRVFRRLPEPYSIVLPVTPVIPKEHMGIVMNVKQVEIPLYLADFVWGVSYDDLEDQGVRLGVQIDEDPDGVRIIGVIPESNAARHGLEKDDVIIRFNGERLKEPFELGHLVRQLKEGDRATVVFKRGEEEKTVEVEFKSQ